MNVKRYLSWVLTFSRSLPVDRKRMKESCLRFVKCFSSKSKNKGKKTVMSSWRDEIPKPTEEGQKIYDYLTSKDVEFIGFMPTIEYFREQGPPKEIEPLYTHACGGPLLLYKVKAWPALLVVGPSVRYNETYLSEAEANLIKHVNIGITE